MHQKYSTVTSTSGRHSLENELVLAEFDGFGRLVRFYDKEQDREILEPGSFGNAFKYYEDIPLFWDAWDVEVYHLEKGWEVNQLGATAQPDPSSTSSTGKLQFSLQLSERSKLQCVASLESRSRLLKFACEVDWNENRRFLVCFSSSFMLFFGALPELPVIFSERRKWNFP